MIEVPQSSGHTIHAAHIEQPTRKFAGAWHARSDINVLKFTGGPRWCYVLAETEDGALRIARYHNCLSGSDFRLRQGEEQMTSPPLCLC